MPKEIVFYLVAVVAWGVGCIATLPPFEGFDETAHYSSVRQIADTGSIPLFGSSYIAESVVGYPGPHPYGSFAPPFDNKTSYFSFFSSDELVKLFQTEKIKPTEPFRASGQPNWQSQHPPLYYVAMAAASRLMRGMDLISELLTLRILSYGLAISGLVISFLAARRMFDGEAVVLGFWSYPILLPMFFPEFGRVGNDSLCLLLAGSAAYMLARLVEMPTLRRWWLLLGISFGLGLLTKALFIPVVFATTVFLIIKFACIDRIGTKAFLQNIALFAGLAVSIGGLWYLYKFIAFGSVSGSFDSIALDAKGGLWIGLRDNFSLWTLARSLVVTFVTWSWAGTWSLVHISPFIQTPVIVLLATVTVAYVRTLTVHRITDNEWLPAYIGVAFVAGLAWHTLVSIALLGHSNTPGWYAHILLPWTAPALGLGIQRLMRGVYGRRAFLVLVAYAAFFQVWAIWCQITLFAGCSTKADDKKYLFPDHFFCLDRVEAIFGNLSVVAWPWLAVCGYVVGIAAFMFATKTMLNAHLEFVPPTGVRPTRER